MTVQDGWDALVQLRDAMSGKLGTYGDQRDDLDDWRVFEDARLAGKEFVARNARSRLVDTVSPLEGDDPDRDGDGWDELEDFRDFVATNYLDRETPGLPDHKPQKKYELGQREEAQDIVDDVDRVFEFEGPDSDDLAHENVDDPDEDPIITEDGRVLQLGRRDPAGLQDELEAMANQDVIDVDAEEIDVEADIEDMTDENEPDSDDGDEQLTDELRGVSDPDADNSPDALLPDEVEEDGDEE